MAYDVSLPGVHLPPARPPWSWPLIYLGVALTALATSILELALTRVLSVLLPPRSAFAGISAALVGLAAGGLFSYLFPGRSARPFHRLGLAALAGGLAVTGAAVLLLLGGGFAGGALSGGVLVALSAPFLLAGAVSATAIDEGLSRVNRICLAAFAGAAAGCLLWVPLVASLGAPNTAIGAAVLFTASSAVWFTAAGCLRGRVLAVSVALGWVTLVAWNVRHHTIDVKWAGGVRLDEPLFVGWNSFSRVAVLAGPGESRRLQVDAEEAGIISRANPELIPAGERRELLHQGPGIPFLLRPNARTLILNPGGGEEVLRAIVGASRTITAVETNPLIASTIAREREAGALYGRPEVRRIVSDGRGFLRRERGLYDVMRILPGSPRAALPGGIAAVLGDHRPFTVEAFEEYLDRLSEDGLLVVSAGGSDPGGETGRLIGALLAALRRAGAREPERHLVLLRETGKAAGKSSTETLLVSRRPWTDADLQTCRSLAVASGIELLLSDSLAGNVPGRPGGPAPLSDNRPFLDGELLLWPSRPGPPAGGLNPGPCLWRLAGFSAAATAAILVLPPVLMRRRAAGGRGLIGFAPYFVFTGAGSVLVQTGLMLSLLPWLGSPTLALTVGMPAMLVAAGAGSYYSNRAAGSSHRSLMGVLALAALWVATLAIVIAPVAGFGGSWPQMARTAATVLLVLPAGFLTGIPLAAGLARLAAAAAPAARWAWSLYAAAGVMGSVTAVLLAVHVGLRETMLFGGLMYLGALPALRFSPRIEPDRPAAHP